MLFKRRSKELKEDDSVMTQDQPDNCAFLVSHKGNVRQQNEDNFFFLGEWNRLSDSEPIALQGSWQVGNMICIYDGMGGESCGEVSSRIAAETTNDSVPKMLANPSEVIIAEILNEANLRICEYEDENRIASMGTTAVVLVFTDTSIITANLGDSRIYLYRQNELHQLSADHNERQSMINNGSLSPDDTQKKKGALTQYLGVREEDLILEPHFCNMEKQSSDLFVLCSDGLTDMVKDDQIAEILSLNTVESVAGKLLEQALENGGRDNITIAVLQI